jgi:hypothetical protein
MGEGNKISTQVIVAIIGLAGVLGAAVITQWDKIFPKKEPAIISHPKDTNISRIDTNNSNVKNEKLQVVQKFEDKLIAVVNDCPNCFEAVKGEQVGVGQFRGVQGTECVKFDAKIKLSEINKDTIYYFKNRTCAYITQLLEGSDSLTVFNRFLELKIKMGYALPDFKEEKELAKTVSAFSNGKSNILLSFARSKNGKYKVEMWIQQA